jgi:hypothetical protein
MTLVHGQHIFFMYAAAQTPNFGHTKLKVLQLPLHDVFFILFYP